MVQNTTTEEWLLIDQLIQGGSVAQAAFEKIFLTHYNQVYRVLWSLLGEHEQVADLCQEVFLILYRQPPRISPTENLSPSRCLIAWLSRIALNLGYNYLRSEQRQRKYVEKLDIDLRYFSDSDPLEEVLKQESHTLIRLILSQLPERQGRLLLLRSAGFSYAEIAECVEVASGSVGTLLARAGRAFSRLYSRYETSSVLDSAQKSVKIYHKNERNNL